MEMYNAIVEVARKKISDTAADEIMDALTDYHGVLGSSARGWVEAQISLPAESLAQACHTALAVVSQAAGAPAIACVVMTEAEFDAREGFVPMPELVGATEAASMLGVSRQRVAQMHAEGSLPGQLVGKSLVFPRSAVEERARTASSRPVLPSF